MLIRSKFLITAVWAVLLMTCFSPVSAGPPSPGDPSPGNPVKAQATAAPAQGAMPHAIASPAFWYGPELQISRPTQPECNRFVPAIVYNYVHDEYLVAWHNTWDASRDIYAQRVSETGDLLSWFTVTTGPLDRIQPALAYNATGGEYLIVWMVDANDDASTYEIWGRLVAWDGSSLGAQFQIGTEPGRGLWTPRVAWNSLRNQYLVVWTARDTTSGLPTRVAYVTLSAGGSQLAGGSISTARQPHQPDVTYNVAADEYLVVWRRMWSSGDGDILGARIAGASGAVVDPPGIFPISEPTEDQLEPSVATNQQHRYIVVWQHAYPGPCCDWDIRGQELDVQGNLVGDELRIAQTTEDETAPHVAAGPGTDRDYVAVWQMTGAGGQEVRAAQWGDVTRGFFNVAAYAFWDAEAPVVAAGGPGYLIAYEGDATGDPTVHRHIYGRIWSREVVFLPAVRRTAP